MDSFRKDDAYELCAAREEKIGLDRFCISGFQISQSKGILEYIDRSFHQHSVFVELIPMFCISRDPRALSEILFGVGINASAVRGIGTR